MRHDVTEAKCRTARFLELISLILICLAPPALSAEAPAGTSDRDRYGGWTKIRFEPTGFFRVSHQDNIWWLVTPEGNAFLSKGVNNVSFRADTVPALGYSPYERAVQTKYGSEAAWAKAVVDRLRGWGFNTLGSWSSPSTFTQNMPYTINLNLATRVGVDWLKGEVGDFFSPDFEAKIEAACRQLCGPHAKDPWLLGYFTDNELRWGDDGRGKESLLQLYLRLPQAAPGRKAALDFLKLSYRDIGWFNHLWGTNVARWEDLTGWEQTSEEAAQSDRLAWQEIVKKGRAEWQMLVARRYFETCKSAIRKADPNHLILGCRFAGSAPGSVLVAMKDSVDVISFNNYGQTAPVETLENIYRTTSLPMMLTEFSFKAMDSGLPNTKGAGKPVATQQDRADGYTAYVQKLAEWLPFMVGFHWFEHTDEPKEGRFDGENSNYGLVTIEDRPWDVLVQTMTRVNAGLETRHARSVAKPEQYRDNAN